MYGIYKDDGRGKILVGYCRTHHGAERAKKHFLKCYSYECGHTFCSITIEQMDSYFRIKAGYAALRVMRSIEEAKLRRMEEQRRISDACYARQSERVNSLY